MIACGTLLLACTSAALYGLTSALQHLASTRADRWRAISPRILLGLATDRIWLLGAVCEAGAVGLHTWALRLAPVSVVQPVLVLGLPFAVLVRDLLAGARPSGRIAAWCLVCGASVAVIVLFTRPEKGSTVPTAAGFAAVAATLLAACTAAGWARHTGHAAVVSAAAAAVLFGMASVLLRVLVGGSAPARITTLAMAAGFLLLTAGAGLVISQWAFQQGPLAAPLAVLTIVDPVVAAVGGALLLGEHPRAGVAELAVVALAVLIGTLSVVALAAVRASPR